MKISECNPLLTYLIYNLISCIIFFLIVPLRFPKYKKNSTIINIITGLIVFVITSALLYWLCSKNYIRVAWVVVTIPLVARIVMTIMGVALIGSATVETTE